MNTVPHACAPFRHTLLNKIAVIDQETRPARAAIRADLLRARQKVS